MRFEFENKEIEKLVMTDKENIACLIDSYFEDVEDADIRTVDVINFSESVDGERIIYTFYDKDLNLIYETEDYKEDLL